MSILNRAKKVNLNGEDWALIKLNPAHEELLRNLDILPKLEEQPKKKPGRPRKSGV